jgi:membrane-bound serine protease (ClpP class)
LLLVGAIVVMIEAHVPTLGVLGGPGVIALGVGAVLAISGLGGGIALGLIGALVLVAVGATVVAVSLRNGVAVRRRRISAGPENMIGHIGVVQTWSAGSGKVLVDGALWRARPSYSENQPPALTAGESVVVERRDGLTLAVRPAEEWELML